MVATRRSIWGWEAFRRAAAPPAGILCIVAMLASGAARADAPGSDDGIFITVQKPINSAVVAHITAKTNRAIQRKIRTIVYDFNPVGRHATGTDEYGACRDLADMLKGLQINSVAFVHKDVSGHRVLPVLACKDIVMGTEAKLGNVVERSSDLAADQKHFYAEIADRRGKSRSAVIKKMLDPELAVFKAAGAGGAVAYYAEPLPPGFVKVGTEPVIPAGTPGFYSAKEAREFDLCTKVCDTRQKVMEEYDLKPSSLREDPLEGREPKAVLFVVNEAVSPAMVETFKRRVRKAVGQQCNFIVVQLEGGSGDAEAALDLAMFLRNLSDEDEQGGFPVTSVAYIPKDAPGAATIVALGCSEIVMGKGAKIGNFEQVEPKKHQALRVAVEDLAEKQGYSPLLIRGMLDRSVEIYKVHRSKGAAEQRLFTKKEVDDDRAGAKEWEVEKLIKKGDPNGEFLILTAERAKELDLAREVVDSFSQLTAIYNLGEVPKAKADFLYELSSFLQKPVVSLFLILIGITCLILELKMPGVSLPGVIAAVCFVLYFWAQSQQLSGQIITLAILLFILGLLLLAVEVFLIPGFGVPGISGIVLIVLSLALATLEKKPETTQEWMSFSRTLGAIGLSLGGAVALAFTVARYLPTMPLANRLVLKPPRDARDADSEEPVDPSKEGLRTETAALLGAIGIAATTLRPSGIARFGDAFIDVVSEGSYIQAGGRVQVIEIEGNRIVVKEV